MGLAPEVTKRSDERVQRTRRRTEPSVVRGRHGARVPDQPDTATSQGKCVISGRRWQRETVFGPVVGVHIVPGPVPDTAQVYVRHCRFKSRPFRVVHQIRPEERRHHVPDDRLPGSRRTVPCAHQRYASKWTSTGNVRRRRNRRDRPDHRP